MAKTHARDIFLEMDQEGGLEVYGIFCSPDCAIARGDRVLRRARLPRTRNIVLERMLDQYGCDGCGEGVRDAVIAREAAERGEDS